MIETQVQNEIVKRCNALGIWCFRVCAEAKREHTPGAPEGTFDLCFPGLGAWMETKMRGKKLSPKQREFARMCDQHRVRYHVVTETIAGPEEMIARAVHVALEWRAEDMRKGTRGLAKCSGEEALGDGSSV